MTSGKIVVFILMFSLLRTNGCLTIGTIAVNWDHRTKDDNKKLDGGGGNNRKRKSIETYGYPIGLLTRDRQTVRERERERENRNDRYLILSSFVWKEIRRQTKWINALESMAKINACQYVATCPSSSSSSISICETTDAYPTQCQMPFGKKVHLFLSLYWSWT
jgi:hypothetical protein